MIQVINRAFDILELIDKEYEKEKVLSEIANELGLNAGTCANILKTMVERKYVEKLDKQRGYCLGPMAYSLSRNSAYRKELIAAAKPEMEWLTKKLNGNTLLSVLEGEDRLVLSKVYGNNELQINSSDKKRAYDTASGQLLIALLDEDEFEDFQAKYGLPTGEEWKDAQNIKKLKEQLRKIRKDGFAVHTSSKHAIGFAVPIYKNDKAIAALSLYLPNIRFELSRKEEFLKLASRSAKKISDRLV